jgi:hypothetical protein
VNSRQRRKYWREWTRTLVALERKYLTGVQKALNDEAEAYINAAEVVGFNQAMGVLNLTNEKLVSVINKMHLEVAKIYGNRINDELTKGQKLSFFNLNFAQLINEILTREALNLLQLIEQVTKERILKLLLQRNIEQWTFLDTARRITAAIASPARALTITRTESNRAANLAAFEAARLQKNEVTKMWIATIDNRTRRFAEDEFDHAKLDGQVQDLEMPFTQLGKKGIQAVVDCPCDPKGPASFTINCRCVLGFRNKRDAAGKLIPR